MPHKLLISLVALLIWCGTALARPVIYRAVVLPYEETFLEGNQELWDKSAELISTFYGLAPTYANIVLANSRGVPFAQQLEEVFPGQRLNSIILSEYRRFLEEKLPELKINSSVLEFISEMRKRGTKFLVYSTTEIDLVQADIQRRKLPVQFIRPSSHQDIAYPPLERLPSRYELPAEEVLVLGGSQYACNQAGMAGLDFALYHEMVAARVEGERPCSITYKVNHLRDIKALLIRQSSAGGAK